MYSSSRSQFLHFELTTDWLWLCLLDSNILVPVNILHYVIPFLTSNNVDSSAEQTGVCFAYVVYIYIQVY